MVWKFYLITRVSVRIIVDQGKLFSDISTGSCSYPRQLAPPFLSQPRHATHLHSAAAHWEGRGRQQLRGGASFFWKPAKWVTSQSLGENHSINFHSVYLLYHFIYQSISLAIIYLMKSSVRSILEMSDSPCCSLPTGLSISLSATGLLWMVEAFSMKLAGSLASPVAQVCWISFIR